MNIKETLQLLDIQEVTTSRQKKNGTREFKLPVKDQYGSEIHVASFASGYVRRTKASGYCPSWQLNKRCESEPQYYKIEKDGETLYRKFTTRTCKLIPNEQDRLEYLISFCLKNYYIKQSNMLSSGEFIPKWKHNDIQEELQVYKDEYRNRVNEVNNPEVKVIVNGHRYNVI
jgi:hypothetical protein